MAGNAAVVQWDAAEQAGLVHKIRGNFWRVMGYSKDKKNYLHPEELLYLIEQGRAVLSADGSEDAIMPPSEAFDLVIHSMQHGVDAFLAYKFLRDSEMVAFRCDRVSLGPFTCEDLGFLPYVYELFLPSKTFRKSERREMRPLAIVFVSNSIEVPQFHQLQHVFAACGDIPVYIVTVDGTGLVTMHEFCSVDRLDLVQPL